MGGHRRPHASVHSTASLRRTPPASGHSTDGRRLRCPRVSGHSTAWHHPHPRASARSTAVHPARRPPLRDSRDTRRSPHGRRRPLPARPLPPAARDHDHSGRPSSCRHRSRRAKSRSTDGHPPARWPGRHDGSRDRHPTPRAARSGPLRDPSPEAASMRLPASARHSPPRLPQPLQPHPRLLRRRPRRHRQTRRTPPASPRARRRSALPPRPAPSSPRLRPLPPPSASPCLSPSPQASPQPALPPRPRPLPLRLRPPAPPPRTSFSSRASPQTPQSLPAPAWPDRCRSSSEASPGRSGSTVPRGSCRGRVRQPGFGEGRRRSARPSRTGGGLRGSDPRESRFRAWSSAACA